jgi:hypothetical protein
MIFIKGVASLGAAMLIGLSALSAQAGYVVDLTQVGSDVVASGSGAIDLSGLTFFSSFGGPSSLINPGEGIILTGPAPILGDQYTGITGPTSFGGGSIAFAGSGSGDEVGIIFRKLVVPVGYSGAALSDTATYDSQTFSSLGATPGTYKWTWGTGANQSFTLVIGTVVPEPSTWAMMLLGFAGLGFMGYQGARRRAALWPERWTP